MNKKPSGINPYIIELIAIPIATGLVVEALREWLLGGWDANTPLIIGAAIIAVIVSVGWVLSRDKVQKQAKISLVGIGKSIFWILTISLVTIFAAKAFDLYWINSHTIVIDPSYHHLGDKSLNFMEPSEPEGIEYSTTFYIEKLSDNPYLSILAKDIDQNLYTSGVLLSINDASFTFLNLSFQDVPTMDEHTVGERRVEIPIPQGLLKVGSNTINILVIPDPISGNVDDVQFRDLKIIMK